MKKKLLILAVAVVLLGISIKYFPYHCNCTAPAATGTSIWVGRQELKVDIADTGVLREQGLSGRTSLVDGSGMLFVFDTPGEYGFWMKDMNFPLDMVWIDPEKRVIAIDKHVSSDTYPQAFVPPSSVLYVIELPSDYTDRVGIKVGDLLSLGSQ